MWFVPMLRSAIRAGEESASPLANRSFRLMLVASAGAFTGYALLLPVVPLWAVRQGAGEVTAGAATGVFMAATVLAQFAVPAFVRRYGYRAGLLAGILLLGLPSPLLAVGTAPAAILGISLVRGLGFGLLTVCGSALIAELLPAGSLARGSGLYGLAVGLPQLLGLPIGTGIAQSWGFVPVFVLATAIPLAAILPTLALPAARPARRHAGDGGPHGARQVTAAVWRPWLPMLAASTGFGALATFLPLMLSAPVAAVALFAVPGAGMLARWLAGHVGDRRGGPGRMLPGALLACGLGLLGIAVLTAHPVLAVAAVGLFGAAFGVVQNDALVAMFARTSAGTASVAWNVAFDAGQGLGAVAVGAVAAQVGFPVAFGVLAVAAFVLLPVAWRARDGG
ncbi:arabinose efflux permease family protein [Saccharomonospora marina XMU15]|uniref:Arabinose efflux permease family protein n=1 Tax=Saccharomonospora marina XMU15 TaxID=882083 RepID=H5X1Y6_9PSEU|nr:MFS transporter [Saccharomonospora marina]EHR52055.1 arabinose efflux permease family protein [Saccharomonospora marina XMU15]